MKKEVSDYCKCLLSCWTAAMMFAFLFPAGMAAQEKVQDKEIVKIPLKVPYLPDPQATDPVNRVKQALYREFLVRNPDVELSAFTGITVGSGESILMLAIIGGSAPDVLNLNFSFSDTFISKGLLYPLDKYVTKKYGSIKTFLDANVPSPLVPVVYREGPQNGEFKAGDHLWFMQAEGLLVRVLCWRKDLFQEAGLDPEKPPKNWDELYEYARILSDPARGQLGFYARGLDAWNFMSFLWSAGAEAIEKRNGEWVAVFDSREAAKAVSFYARLNTERWIDADGNVQYGYTAASTPNAPGMNFSSQGSSIQYAMFCPYIDDNKMGGDIDPELIGTAPFPIGPSGKRGTEVNTRIHGIFNGINGRTNKARQYVSADKIREAAFRFIDFMASDDAKRLTTQFYVKNGMARNVSPLWLRKFGYTEYLKYFPPELEALYNDAVKNGKPEPYGRNCQSVYNYIALPLQATWQAMYDEKLPTAPEDEEKRLDMIQGYLREAVATTNEMMIGKISKEERASRNFYAGIVAILIVSVFCFVVYRIWQIFSPKDALSGKTKGVDFSRNWIGYLLMLPALFSILLWIYCPMVSGSGILFQNYNVLGKSEWVGLNNISDVLFSPEWWIAVWNTGRYMLIILAFGFIAPVILAVLLQEVSHGKIIYRTLYYLPAVMSGIVVLFVWKLFYQSGPTGILNQVIMELCGLVGIQFKPINWLTDANWAMLACIIPTIWAGMGPGCLIYLAALKGVPDDIYEAAEIDGANFFQKIWHVTLPSIKSLMMINFVGAFIAAANSGGMILVMTFGAAKTEVAELHIFKEAYINLKFGSAVAMAWMLGVLTLMFTIYQLRKLSNMEFKTTGK